MFKTIIITAAIGTTSIFTVVGDFQKAMPMPVEVCTEDPRLTDVKDTLKILGRDVKFAKDLLASASAKGINPVLWTCNIESESGFKITAKSPKGYKGLGQTPEAVMRTGFELGDLTYAACVLDEKMKIANGDIHKALMLYKGGNNPAAKKEAEKVFALYNKIQKKLKEQHNG